ncbi:hypothetical protein Acid345_2705 [Candidatus Koribacter versatilis Ellin345]|uniref:Response regulator receiver protein n=1 Tax=Koribacter versatilis (strain Ellin345) TaxID=204669 RepID=Q1IN44_KORVE|nr:hypothetical protein [Candidatus Koribacter versatilis]ABF41706.1 hypothetical protein Acid345_2705 [Candidatus Koribacter versatilis Ellin345]
MRTVLCIDEQQARLLKISNVLKAAGYICIVSYGMEHAERSLAMYKIDLILAHGQLRPTVRQELQKIRDVPLLVMHDQADAIAPEDRLAAPNHASLDDPEALLRTIAALLGGRE